MSVQFKITGLNETKVEILKAVEQELKEISVDLIKPLRNYSPIGATQRLKREWVRQKVQKSAGKLSGGGATNSIPYAAVQDLAQRQHLKSMRGAKEWDTSLIDEFNKAAEADIKGRMPGRTLSRSAAAKYSRSYRYGLKWQKSKFQTYAAKFVERAVESVGLKLLDVVINGKEAKYIIDPSARISKRLKAMKF